MSITQTVRCDDCNRPLLEGAKPNAGHHHHDRRCPLGPDKPPRIHHLHFCKDACIGSFLTKQAAAKLDAAVKTVAESTTFPPWRTTSASTPRAKSGGRSMPTHVETAKASFTSGFGGRMHGYIGHLDAAARIRLEAAIAGRATNVDTRTSERPRLRR